MPQIRRWWQSSSPNAGETVRPPESGCGGSEKDESARKMAKPLAIDLFCGLGGWTEGLLAEGYDHRRADADELFGKTLARAVGVQQ